MTPPAPDLREQLQQSLGSAYRLERELGGGGMSRVFVAVETAFDRHVVVKVLLPELAAGVSVDRFRREIQLAAQLQHPHIVPLLAAGESGGLPYFTMPFVVGESLRSRLLRDRELPVPEAIRLLRDVASALEYAHGRGVVHRDIKPDNVLLTHGVAVVTDFGVAKALTSAVGGTGGHTTGLTSMGVTLGTPAYMAPEQASADPAMDHRVDVYAFGIMAYEMMTGQTPFAGRSPQAILGAHLAVLPEPVTLRRPGMPPAMAALIMRCLEKHAADRPQAASDLIATLDTLTTPSGGTVPIHGLTPPPRPSSRPNRTMMSAAAALAVAAVLGIWVWSMRPRPRPSEPPRRAAAVAEGATTPRDTNVAGLENGGRPGAPDAADAAGAGGVAARQDKATGVARAGPSEADTGAARSRPATPPVPAGRAPARSGTPPVAASRASPPAAARGAPGAGDALVARLADQARAARAEAAARGTPPATLARGDSSVARAESLRAASRPTDAAAELSVAIATWRNAAEAASASRAVPSDSTEDTQVVPAPPTAPTAPAVPSERAAPAPPAPSPSSAPAPAPAPDAAPRIRALYDAYAAALQTGSVDAIRRAYPGLTDDQARDWQRFFGAVKDLKVTLRVARLELHGDTGEADLAGVYTFTDPGTRRLRQDSVSFHSTVRRDARGWRIEAVR